MSRIIRIDSDVSALIQNAKKPKESNNTTLKRLLIQRIKLAGACKFADNAIKNMCAGQAKAIHKEMKRALA